MRRGERTDLIKESVHMLETVDTEARPPLRLTTHLSGGTEHTQQHLLSFSHSQLLGNLKYYTIKLEYWKHINDYRETLNAKF